MTDLVKSDFFSKLNKAQLISKKIVAQLWEGALAKVYRFKFKKEVVANERCFSGFNLN